MPPRESNESKRVPITCMVCRKVVAYFPSGTPARRRVLTTVCDKCQTPHDAPHAPRDPLGK